jgi:quinoprotein glucose dehydrogenase
LSLITVAAQSQTDWPVAGHDPGSKRFSPLKQVNTENVAKLEVAWTYDTRVAGLDEDPSPNVYNQQPAPENRRPRPPRQRQSQSIPLVIGDVMYLSTAYNHVVALDAETGKELWAHETEHPPARRGIAYWPGDDQLPPQIVLGTTGGWLIALNAKTGKLMPGFGEGGKVNLRQQRGARFPDLRVALSSPPAIYKNLIITGAHSQERPSLGPDGNIRAWDIHTGKLAWTFHTIPRPGELNHDAWQGDQWVDRSGANAWGFITVDVERGIVYAPLGTPATDFYGGDRLGSNLYGSSLVALDASTGKLKWYFQTTHHDNWDYDLSAPPALIDVRREGRTIPAVSIYTKQGLLFIFNRVTGEPVFGVEERAVASDNPVPGDEYSPTQPFPLKPPPLARITFEPHEIAKVTPEHEAYCKELLTLEGGAMTGGPYPQYGPKLRVIFPGWTGGGNWDGAAFYPELGYLIVPSQNLGMLNKMVKSEEEEDMWVRVGPDNPPERLGGHFWDGRKSWPCQSPPWGELIAVNVNTGDVAWRVPLGSFEELDALGVPPTGTPFRGGPIATAGGLVFIAASQDARFRAFDARTGKELWVTNLSQNGRSVPITYQGKSGRQYVAIMAGGEAPVARTLSEEEERAAGGRLYVFALPGGGSPAAPSLTDAGPTVPTASLDTTSAGRLQTETSVDLGPSGPQARENKAAVSSAASSPRLEEEGKVLVKRMCASCHALETILTPSRTSERWGVIVDKMVPLGMQGTDAEIDLVIEYLSKYHGTQ